MDATGEFDVSLEPQTDPDAPAGRLVINKTYRGDLNGIGCGQMLSKRVVDGESVYAAIEEFSGTLNGRQGGFTLFHTGRMSAEHRSLSIRIVEGSGSEELAGVSGAMSITQPGADHHYTLRYEIEALD